MTEMLAARDVPKFLAYVVCNRLIDPETWEHCEFDGEVLVGFDSSWRCPGCGWLRHGYEEKR